ncbi:MAG: hypothetical protein K8T25_13600 [Planctomycetia bacterium]|nr:hypothetical protein [Planctomycetia bacterium]
MSQSPSGIDPAAATRRLRQGVYLLLAAIAIGQATGRILAVNSIDRLAYDAGKIQAPLEKYRREQESKGVTGEQLTAAVRARRNELQDQLSSQRPFLSSNDRSRWLTIRALVEDHTFAIDQIVSDPKQARVWDTIDMVKHRDKNGDPHLYSSKPPLLSVLLAGPYWVIYHTTGLSLRDQPHVVVRIILLLVNVLPLVFYFWLLAGIVERYGKTDWGRILVVASAAFGTFLTTFAVTLNNHLHAAFFVMAAVYAGLRIWYDGRREMRYFVAAGFFSALAAATELPALSFCALLGLGMFLCAKRPALLGFVPAAVLVLGAELGTNYISHGHIEPPYSFRTEGKDWETGNWYNYTYKVGGVEKSSYWKRDPQSMAARSPVDRGEPSRGLYAFHALIGHHGIFSLTPLWLLSLAGTIMMLRSRRGESDAPGTSGPSLFALGAFVAILSVVCIGFYLGQGTENRNYGGGTSGLRWAFWLVPLWLTAMLPAADWTDGRPWRRLLAVVLVGFSALSASYPIWNPWTHPWLAQWMIYIGWVKL